MSRLRDLRAVDGSTEGEGRKLLGQKHSAADAEDAGTRCAGAGKEGP